MRKKQTQTVISTAMESNWGIRVHPYRFLQIIMVSRYININISFLKNIRWGNINYILYTQRREKRTVPKNC